MSDFALHRYSGRDDGAFGVLLLGGKNGSPICLTLERTYSLDDATVLGVELGGQKVKIPTGTYRCHQRVFQGGKPAPYNTLEIMVPGHSAILFHRGAEESHSEGCVLVGMGLLELGPGRMGISGSVEAFGAFWRAVTRLPGPDYSLDVTG